MVKSMTANPVGGPRIPYDPLELYRSPLFRTMAGYKFLSGTFLLCGAIAVPALLYTGQTTGYAGAAAVGVASILPLSLQTIFVPHYISRISLAEAPVKSKHTFPLDSLSLETRLKIEYFTTFGYLASSIEQIDALRPHKSYRWINVRGQNGRGYYVDTQAAGPIMRKILKMIEQPDKPETWRV